MALLGRQGAAFQGHLRDVTVRRPVTPVTVDENGVTVLMWAAIGGQLHVVQWLLREGGSDAAERDKHGMTALLLAALHQKWSCVQWLLQAGFAEVGDRDEEGTTALLFSVLALHAASAQMLLRDGKADIADRDKEGDDVWWTMHDARSATHTEDLPSTTELADLYSVLRCDGAPKTPLCFIAALKHNDNEGRPLSEAHLDLLLKTERVHASPYSRSYRALRLALLRESVTPEPQITVLEYVQPRNS